MPVTVDEALRKGYNTVKLPSGLLFVAGVVAGFVLHNILNYPTWVYAPAIGAGLISSIVYWYVKITKWRIWAYENVDHIHEFEQKAIDAGYIKSADSFSDKLAVKTDEDKQKLTELEKRFEQKDVYEDDILVPNETLIRFSKGSELVHMISAVLFTGIIGYLLLTSGSNILGLVSIALGGFWFYSSFKDYNNKAPQITLNANGIQTANTPIYAWASVSNERVKIESSGKYSHTYLIFDHPDGEEKLNIEDLGINGSKLEHLMHVYRARSEKAQH